MTLIDRNILLRTGEFYADVAAAYDEMKYNMVGAMTMKIPRYFNCGEGKVGERGRSWRWAGLGLEPNLEVG